MDNCKNKMCVDLKACAKVMNDFSESVRKAKESAEQMFIEFNARQKEKNRLRNRRKRGQK